MPKNQLMKSLSKITGTKRRYRGCLIHVLPDGSYRCFNQHCVDLDAVDRVIDGAAQAIADSIINKEVK